MELNTLLPAPFCCDKNVMDFACNLICCSTPKYSLELPTEVVVINARIVEPRLARGWETVSYWYDNRIMRYDELRQLPGFKGTCGADRIILVEIWHDNGDDGHVEFVKKGYALIRQSELRAKWLELNEMAGFEEMYSGNLYV